MGKVLKNISIAGSYLGLTTVVIKYYDQKQVGEERV